MTEPTEDQSRPHPGEPHLPGTPAAGHPAQPPAAGQPAQPAEPGHPPQAAGGGWPPPVAGAGHPAQAAGAGWPPQAAGWSYPGVWPGGYDWYDPLVNPPGATMSGWFHRGWGVVRRSGVPLTLILLITAALPTILFGLVSVPLAPGVLTTPGADADPDEAFRVLSGLLRYEGILLAVAVVVGLVQAVGWAGGGWLLTQQAAGRAVTVGAAFRYGLRRAPALWAWYVLSALIGLAGTCACVLPGLYLGFALSMVGPIVLFERRFPFDRRNPIGRSFRMVHARLGMVLGRVATLVGLALAGGFVIAVLQALGNAAGGLAPGGRVAFSVAYVATTVLGGVLYVPIHLMLMIGLIVTYAEQRAQEGPVNTAALAGELGAEAPA